MYGTCLGNGAHSPRIRAAMAVESPAAVPVYGSDVYTDDSSPAAAAVHAGLVQCCLPPSSAAPSQLLDAQVEPGETRDLLLTIRGPQAGFIGSVRHGVASKSVCAL